MVAVGVLVGAGAVSVAVGDNTGAAVVGVTSGRGGGLQAFKRTNTDKNKNSSVNGIPAQCAV